MVFYSPLESIDILLYTNGKRCLKLIKNQEIFLHNFNALKALNHMFKKGYTYGEILLYLYSVPENRSDVGTIRKRITLVSPIYFKEVIEWLIADDLIIKESTIVSGKYFIKDETIYRISYKGFGFIKDLKEKRATRIISSISIIVACAGIITSSIFTIMNSHGITKVEIVKVSYLQKTSKQDSVNLYKSPSKRPIITDGKSDLRSGRLK